MALGQSSAIDKIKEFVSSKLESDFEYKEPFLIKEDEFGEYFILIQTSNLGRLQIGAPEIRIKSVHKFVDPVLKIHNIPCPEFRSTIRQTQGTNNLSNLPADSESELNQCFAQLVDYLDQIAIPFWNKFSDLESVVHQIEKSKELHNFVNEEVDFNAITIFFLTSHSLYVQKKKEFLKNQIELANYSEEYNAYPNAFKQLVEELGVKNDTQHTS